MPAASAPAPAPASAPSMPPMPSPRPRSPPANALAPKGPAFVRLRAYDLLAPQHREHLATRSPCSPPPAPAGQPPTRECPRRTRRPHLGSARRGLRPRHGDHPNHQPSEMTFLVVRVTLEGNVDVDGRPPLHGRALPPEPASVRSLASPPTNAPFATRTSTTTCLGRPARSTDPRRFTSPASRRSPASKTSRRRARNCCATGSRDTAANPLAPEIRQHAQRDGYRQRRRAFCANPNSVTWR